MMQKLLSANLALALCCLLAAACQTTPPAAKPQPPAKSTQQTQLQQPAARPQESISQGTQPAAEEYQPAVLSQQQKRVHPATPPAPRRAAANQLAQLGSSVSAGVGGVIRKVETLLGIKREPARKPVAATAAGVRGARRVPQDLVAVIVTGAIIVVGSCLTLAAIVAGRRRRRGLSAEPGKGRLAA
jgi:hypothetical protein